MPYKALDSIDSCTFPRCSRADLILQSKQDPIVLKHTRFWVESAQLIRCSDTFKDMVEIASTGSNQGRQLPVVKLSESAKNIEAFLTFVCKDVDFDNYAEMMNMDGHRAQELWAMASKYQVPF